MTISLRAPTPTTLPTAETWNRPVAEFLISPDGDEAARDLLGKDLRAENSLALLSDLRKQHAPEIAGALLTLARLRRKASAKFPNAEKLFFTPDALQQATAWPVALHRAKALASRAGPGNLLDLGCGIGGDTMALARFRSVIAYERDPVRLRLAEANLTVVGLTNRVEFRLADWTEELAAGRLAGAAAYVDPSRRKAGRRVFSLHETEPPLSVLLRLQKQFSVLAIKVMPGVDADEVPADCSVEFVSHEGVCKEAVLWSESTSRPQRLANVFVSGVWHKLCASGRQPPVGALQAGAVLYEPDPAVIRAGSFAELCDLLDAHLFDPQIAYLAADEAHPTPFAQAFRIDEVHAFSLKLLNRRLKTLEIGRVELKKRGFPVEPEQLRSRLKLTSGGKNGVVIFTRRGDERIMCIGSRIA